MKVLGAIIPGLRVLRQDPWECLVSFITSSNNNIKRIIQCLQKLRERYGPYLCTVQKLESGEWEIVREIESHVLSSVGVKSEISGTRTLRLHQFPTPEQFSVATEEELRELGMGYRARFELYISLYAF